ncbi:MAG: hypothetical protein WAW02_07130 [Sideroxyarcus sp.]
MEYSEILERSIPNQQFIKAANIERWDDPRIDTLDDLLLEFGSTPEEKHHVASTGDVCASSDSMASKAALGESWTAHGNPKTVSAVAKGKTAPLLSVGPSTHLTSTIKLPIDAWNKHQNAVAKLSDEALAQRVQALSLQTASDGIGPAPYPEIREEFCATNIELNFRKKFAPRFREMRRSLEGAGMGEADLLRDRICIDLHWLHCRNERRPMHLPGSVDPSFASLLLRPEFDFEAAWRFARLDKKLDTRAAWLKLPTELAWQLASIENDTMKSRFYTIMHGERRKGHKVQVGYYDVLAILESVVPMRLQSSIRTWATVWMCDRMIRTPGAATPKTKLALLHAVITGRATPLDRKDISSRLDSCEKYLRSYSRCG